MLASYDLYCCHLVSPKTEISSYNLIVSLTSISPLCVSTSLFSIYYIFMSCNHVERSDSIKAAFALGVKLSFAVELGTTDWKPSCTVCGSPTSVACLTCGFLGCGHHGPDHEHALGVRISSRGEGFLWCFRCGDIITDPEFEDIRLEGVSEILRVNRPPRLKNTHKKRPPYHAHTGLRGFYNMGATCYMNVILQALIHNPLVRAFFLGGGHVKDACSRGWCISCCVDRIFTEFFSGPDVSGYGIPDLLLTAAQNKPDLTGSTQQDAHEFAHFLFDQFHTAHFACPEFPGNSPSQAQGCQCVVHRNFAGSLEVTLECASCGRAKSARDPLLDVSLEVQPLLHQSFQKFTSKEKLGSYACEDCEQRNTTTRSALLKNVPPVLLVQLKRFKHLGVGNGRKIDEFEQFDLEIDLAPYTITNEKHLYYELYGVITHIGSIDTGHYVCMMKHATGTWYHFDDNIVTPVSVDTVLKTNAYLLFYIKKWAL